MYNKTTREENSSCGFGKRIIFKAVAGALSLIMLQTQAASNIFADVPLRLQSKSTTTTAYNIKPNITLYIDDSGSMSYPIGYECQYYTYTCKSLNPRTKQCANWGLPSSWSGKNNTVSGIPDLGNLVDTIDDPDLPVDQHKQIHYGICNAIGIDGDKTTSKMTLVQRVLSDIVDTNKNEFYFSLQPMNNWADAERNPNGSYPAFIIPDYNKFYDTSELKDYQFIKDHINGNKAKSILGLRASGGTPTAQRLNAVVRNTVMNKLRYRCQKSYVILLSDGLDAGSLPITDSKYYAARLNYGYDGYFDGSNIRPDGTLINIDNRSNLLNYYTNTLANKSFGDYIYSKNFVYNGGAAYDPTTNKFKDRRLVDEAGQPWNGPDPLGDKPGHTKNFTQTAQTFTIGVGLGSRALTIEQSRAIKYLLNGASPKPDYDPKTNPNARYFFNANSLQEINEAFKKIFEEIKGKTTTTTVNVTTTAPTVGVSSTTTNNAVIVAQVETGDWSSKICIHKKDDTDFSTCEVQPGYANRQLLLNDGTNTYLYSDSLKNLNNNYFLIPDNDKNKTEWLNGLLTWLSRSKADNEIKKDGYVLNYRERKQKENFGDTRNMGDIDNNPIITIGDNPDEKYQKYMITSANDGMVYVFQSTNNETQPYDLKFNFMPMAIERQSNDGSDIVAHYYKDLTDNNYGRDSEHPHRFLLNGGFSVYETEDRAKAPNLTFMVSNMGQAGRGAFAINIGGKDLISGNPIGADNMGSSDWYKNVFLFQTPSGENNKFGFTIGTPGVARVRVNTDKDGSADSIKDHIREAAFLNNGYNYSENYRNLPIQQSGESALYIYDVLGIDVGTAGYVRTGMRAGQQIAKLVAPGGSGGLSSPVVYDIDGDGVADLVYAGDYAGNMFRFDLRSPNPANWKATKIFSAGAPITAAPAIYEAQQNPNTPSTNQKTNRKLVIVFGTGSDIYQSDLENKDQQTIYGIYDDLTPNVDPLVSKNSLLEQVMTYNGETGMLSNKPFSADKYRGWYFNLNTDGERVVTPVEQLLYSGLVLTRTYSVSSDNKLRDPCQPVTTNEKTNVYTRKTQFNALTGGALLKSDPHIIFDPNAPLVSSTGVNYLLGIKITGGSNNNILSLSGKQSPLGKPKENQSSCLRVAPGIDGSDGSKLEISGVPMCPISIKRLSWREVKTSYLD
ncbi:PilC/PilY family type IV pilus protein [Snodgrassella sp. CS2]|uniref:PilC/PilY family type IV pilus protein n=1 Tax=Snodgrassella sp. CS2 TaxID=3418953 RepID=UPI003CFFBF84